MLAFLWKFCSVVAFCTCKLWSKAGQMKSFSGLKETCISWWWLRKWVNIVFLKCSQAFLTTQDPSWMSHWLSEVGCTVVICQQDLHPESLKTKSMTLMELGPEETVVQCSSVSHENLEAWTIMKPLAHNNITMWIYTHVGFYLLFLLLQRIACDHVSHRRHWSVEVTYFKGTMDLRTTRRSHPSPVGRRLSHVYNQQAWKIYHGWMLWKRLLSCYTGLPRGVHPAREDAPYYRRDGPFSPGPYSHGPYYSSSPGSFSPGRLPSLPENYALLVSIFYDVITMTCCHYYFWWSDVILIRL